MTALFLITRGTVYSCFSWFGW